MPRAADTECRSQGFMALSGAPVTQEDHASRTVRAALEVVAALSGQTALQSLAWPSTPSVRLGLHTGRVVVEALSEAHQTPYVALNHVTQRAERLQQGAPPRGILVSAATARLVQRAVRLEPWAEDVPAEPLADTGGAYRVVAAQPWSWAWTAASGDASRPAEAHLNLGNALARQGQSQVAIRHYTEALQLQPTLAEAQNGLGAALADQGRLDATRARGKSCLAAARSPPTAQMQFLPGRPPSGSHHGVNSVVIPRNRRHPKL